MTKSIFKTLLSLSFILFFIACDPSSEEKTKKPDTYVKDNYYKKEVAITMRDGIKLHTTIYSPKDKSKTYPILLQRTPYSARPYGKDTVRT